MKILQQPFARELVQLLTVIHVTIQAEVHAKLGFKVIEG